MPELPEVESFRHLLLGLVVGEEEPQKDDGGFLQIEAVGESNRIRLNSTDREEIARHYACTNILRKGKQLCLVLTCRTNNTNNTNKEQPPRATKYLFLHMGMTGQIRVDGKEENWGDKKTNAEEPASIQNASDGRLRGGAKHKTNMTRDESSGLLQSPKYTLLIFRANNYTAYFCDPRKFGSCNLADDCSALDELAPDALDHDVTNNNNSNSIVQERILSALCHQSRGIKAILLDQKRAISGVGNWVADEVLYHCHMHPDQTLLTRDEALKVMQTAQSILRTAVQCLVQDDTHYPEEWLFGYRWTKKQQGSKDAQGRTITFLQSGGRTSAIVASIQKLDKQRSRTPKSFKKKNTDEDGHADSAIELLANELTSAKPAATRKRKVVTDFQQFRHEETTAATSSVASYSRKNTDISTPDTEATTESSAESSMATKQRRRSPRFRVP